MKFSFIFIIAQILGILVFITGTISHYKNDTKKVYFYNSLTNILSCTQYFILGAFTGAIACLIGIFRNFLFERYEGRPPLYALLIVIFLLIISNIWFIHNVFDLIPVLNVIVFAYALWTKDVKTIKIFGIITCISGTVYDIYAKAYATILYELSCGYAGVVSYLQLKSNKKKLN